MSVVKEVRPGTPLQPARGSLLPATRHAGQVNGGRGGIRTPDTLSGMPVFKTGAINHSASSPQCSAVTDCTSKPVFSVVGQFGIALPQGLKPAMILRDLMYGLKPVPFKLTHYRIFKQGLPGNGLSGAAWLWKRIASSGLPPVTYSRPGHLSGCCADLA